LPKHATNGLQKSAHKAPRPRAGSNSAPPVVSNPELTQTLRALFWTNVAREMLTSLSAMLTVQNQPSALDGRLSILTHAGERIPIAEVHPLFACSIPGTDAERDLSAAVQCSVFRVVTPSGEAFTLPLSEVRAFHAVSEELQRRIQEEMGGVDSGTGGEPFGFAAFAETSRQQRLEAESMRGPSHPAIESANRAEEREQHSPATPRKKSKSRRRPAAPR